MFNISGPYAVGKDTVLRHLLTTFEGQVHRVRTITTRPVSPEADPSYQQIDREEFERRITVGRWLVNYQLNDAVAYGTSIDEVEAEAAAGRVSIHSIFPGSAGAGALRTALGERLFSIGMVATTGSVENQLAELRRRLISRGRDDTATIDARLKHQLDPMAFVLQNPSVETPNGWLPVFDQIVINEHLDETMRSVEDLFSVTFGLRRTVNAIGS